MLGERDDWSRSTSADAGVRHGNGGGDERARRHLRCRVERQRQHSSISTSRRAPPACLKRTAKRAGGKTPSPASGHSTNAIASSKYGSRSPHSAAETPSKR